MEKQKTHWTADDIPNLENKVVVITGANTGIGFPTTLELIRKGATVIMGVRKIAPGQIKGDPTRYDRHCGQDAFDKIMTEFPSAKLYMYEVDLTFSDSVKLFAQTILDKFDRIDILINNAATAARGKACFITNWGVDVIFATNHLGPFLLTHLLIDKIKATPNSRIVTVSSNTHRNKSASNFDDFKTIRDGLKGYGRTKLCNLMFTYALNRKLEGSNAIAVACHPGTAYSEILRYFSKGLNVAFKLISQSSAMGSLPTLRAATDPDVKGGEYYGPNGAKGAKAKGYPELEISSDTSYNEKLQKWLWKRTESLLGIGFGNRK